MLGFVKSFLINFRNLEMQNKLTLSHFIFVLLPLVIVGYLAYTTAAASIKEEVSRYLFDLLEQVNDNIDNSLADIDRVASSLGSEASVQGILQKDGNQPRNELILDDEVMNSRIDAAVGSRSNIKGLFVFSYNGSVYKYKGGNNSLPRDYIFTSTNWFNTMSDLGQTRLLIPTHLQDDIISEGQPKNVFSYVKQINDIYTRKSIGSILIDIDTDVFKNIIDKLKKVQGQEFLIIDNNKTILYHTQKEYISTQFRSPYVVKLLKQRKGNLVENINSRPVLITFSTSLSTNWTVISITPENLLYSRITKLQYVIVLTIFICIFLAFFVSIILSSTITKPISILRTSMKKAESGDFDIKLPINTRDEIGELGRSFTNMLARIKELILKAYTANILKKEAELNALQAQINPHFLFNTLQLIDIMAEKEGNIIIGTVCQALSDIFRYSISRGKEIVPLSSELEHIKNYMYIQKLRFEEKVEVRYEIDEDLLKYQIVKLVLQPLVENALFYGVECCNDNCMIEVSAKKSKDVITLSVEDSGQGMDSQQLEALRNSLSEEIVHAEVYGHSRKSIGLKNVNARIKLYFGEEYGVQIESELNKGTRVAVTLPAILYEPNGGDTNVTSTDCR